MSTIAEMISQTTNNSSWSFKAISGVVLAAQEREKELATLRKELAELNRQICLQEMAFAKAVQENFLGYTGEVRSNINRLKAREESLQGQLRR